MDRVLFNAGRYLNAKVASKVGPTAWRWSRNVVVRDIIAHPPTSFLPNIQQEDSVSWLELLIRSTLCNLLGVLLELLVLKWCGFKHHVPRWAVIQWMIILGRLPTRDKLCQWRIVSDPICPLCCVGLESHLHLFFDCPFSSFICSSFLMKNGISRQILVISEEIRWDGFCRGGTTSQHLVFNLSLAACTYHIWRERNARIFQRMFNSYKHQLVTRIENDVRSLVSSWRAVWKSDLSKLIFSSWSIGNLVFGPRR